VLEEFDEEIQEYLKPTINTDPSQMIFPQVKQAVPIIFDEQARYWTIARWRKCAVMGGFHKKQHYRYRMG
jgi:ABC-type antimicrobial peptide transport system ATPase subunit